MNKNKTKELLELRDLLNNVISNTDKYNKQKDKSPTALNELSASLKELNTLSTDKNN